MPRVAARQPHSLGVDPRFVRAPRPVAAIRFPAPPPRFRPPWGLSGTAPRHRPEATATPVLRLARLRSVRPRDPPPRPEAERRLSWGLFPYGTFRQEGSGRSRGFHAPAPSALRVCVPSRRLSPLLASRRPVGRSSAHGVRPSGPCSTPPAAPLSGPLLSCRFLRPARRPDGRDSRGFLRTGKGPDAPPKRPPNLALLGFAPPRLSPPTAFVTGFPAPSPSCPSGRKYSLRFYFRAGLQGIVERRNRLVSLETAGLPGVLHLLDREAPLRAAGSRAYGFTATGKSAPPTALRDSGGPDRSSAPARIGATDIPDTRHQSVVSKDPAASSAAPYCPHALRRACPPGTPIRSAQVIHRLFTHCAKGVAAPRAR